MEFWTLVGAMVLSEFITLLIIFGIPLVILGIFAIPCSIAKYYINCKEDKQKTKELIEKGADPNKFFVKNGIIYNKE